MTKRTYEYTPGQIEMLAETDVVVAGGGTSGFIAAIAAARAGAKVILVERLGHLGSCTTTPYNTQVGVFRDSEGKVIIKGIPFALKPRTTGVSPWVKAFRSQGFRGDA